MNDDFDLKALGEQTAYKYDYDPGLLERIPRHQGETTLRSSWVSLVCTEFTSLCPKTAQPDFARIFVNYIPEKFLVESKSFKLYLFSFRNHGSFHETCVENICRDLEKLLEPRYLEVCGEFTPRGGIAIYPFSYCFTPSYSSFATERVARYAPGKYSFTLGRPY